MGVNTAIVNTEAEVEQARSGTILDVTPTVNQDGTITLELHPQYVSVDLSNAQAVTNRNGSTSFTNSVTLPVYKSQEINSTVTIPDGGVAVMGGLVQDTEDNEINRTPHFGKVPVVGNLFKNEQLKRTKSYLLIFVQARQIGYHDGKKKN